jgi:hypothetical protein
MSKDEKIEEILNNFDFDRVFKTMTFLDWTWLYKGVPSIYQLVVSSKKKLEDSYDYSLEHKEDWGIHSGGLKVRSYYENGKVDLSLEFVLTDWDTLD